MAEVLVRFKGIGYRGDTFEFEEKMDTGYTEPDCFIRDLDKSGIMADREISIILDWKWNHIRKENQVTSPPARTRSKRDLDMEMEQVINGLPVEIRNDFSYAYQKMKDSLPRLSAVKRAAIVLDSLSLSYRAATNALSCVSVNHQIDYANGTNLMETNSKRRKIT